MTLKSHAPALLVRRVGVKVVFDNLYTAFDPDAEAPQKVGLGSFLTAILPQGARHDELVGG
jgi:hypothetical protein